VQKTGLQPTSGKNPNIVVVDNTVIQLNDQRYWLYPDANDFLYVRLFPTRTINGIRMISSKWLKPLSTSPPWLPTVAPWPHQPTACPLLLRVDSARLRVRSTVPRTCTSGMFFYQQTLY
jgi:hypothetical protein